MRTDLYSLNKEERFDLEAHIRGIVILDLERRNRQSFNDTIRLEHAEKRGNYWFLDFVKIRTHHGPGRAGKKTPIEGFDLNDDEGFGEETALLWNTANNWCAVQYNHHGVRARAMAEYLALFERDNPQFVTLTPKIDDSVHAKIAQKKLVSKVVVSVAPKNLTEYDYAEGLSVGAAIKDLGTSDADQIEVSISTRRRKSGLDFPLTQFVKWVEKLGHNREKPAITGARVTARKNANEFPEVLDLLDHRVTTDGPVSPGKDKRYSREHRWTEIERAFLLWTPIMAR